MEIELAVLTGDRDRECLGNTNVPELVQWFLEGKFESVLSDNVGRHVFGRNTCCDSKDLKTNVSDNVRQFLGVDEKGKASRELELLVLGASCLQLFVQNNWLGPLTSTPPAQFLSEQFTEDQLQETALSCLSENGEPVYGLSRFAGFLYLGRLILQEGQLHVTTLQTWDWWLARLLIVQQSLLEQRSPDLRSKILELLQNLSMKEPLMTDDKNRDVAVLFHVEASRMCQRYWEDQRSQDHVTQARKMVAITAELHGAMGKRTRFQQDHKAQLVLKVTRDSGETSLAARGLSDPEYSTAVSKRLQLGDDTVLEQIEFQDESDSVVTQLSPLEQTLIFTNMEAHRRSRAVERLTEEETMTYLEFVIGQVRNWSLSIAALSMRSRMEKGSRRRVERSMQQIEELVNQIQRPDPTPDLRLHLSYAAQPPTSWQLQSELADLLRSLGLVTQALDIYERLHLWEDAVSCYQEMGKLNKAESVIRQELVAKETPSLLCFLGDVTGDKSHYQRAWELSNHRSARAMRCLALSHFNQERFEEAVECFEKSLAINSLQIPVWFTCGCACMAAKNYEAATKAFRRCVNIDSDNFEAWSNLATAQARLGKRRAAFLTVKEAIKCNYQNWRLWENCLMFAVNCSEFDEAIRAYNQLLSLKDKYLDTEVLRILVLAVTSDLDDASGNPAQRLHPKLLELFGQLAAKMTLDAEAWRLYSDLHKFKTPSHEPNTEKMVECLKKSHSTATQKPDWERDTEQCDKVAQQTIQLAKAQLTFADELDNAQRSIQALNSTKLTIKGVLSRIKLKHEDPVSKELREPLKTSYETLDQELQTILSKLQQLQAS